MNRVCFDSTALFRAVDSTRRDKGLSWRLLSYETGLSKSLFRRLSQGGTPDANSLAAIVRWLGVSAENFFVERPVRNEPLIDPALGTQLDIFSILSA